MIRLEVRCCCVPEKVLGTLPVDHCPLPGDRITFPLMTRYSRPGPREALAKTMAERPSIMFEVSMWSSLEEAGVALKREGVDLETLRRVPGFIEAAPRW
jgi:hypothetical protein